MSTLAPAIEFTPVDCAYVKVRLAGFFLFAVPVLALAAIAIAAAGLPRWAWIIWAAAALGAGLRAFFIVRQVRALGYAEEEGELVLRSGRLFRKIEVVPYGRMQKVEVNAGPLMRRAGLATVNLVTASASTDGSIPGVRAQEAERLREKLTRLGEATLEGL